MPPRNRRGGGLSAKAGGDAGIRVSFHVEGVDKTQAEFKAIRRGINNTLRDAQEKIGERIVLPAIKARFPVASTENADRGLPRGRMRDSLYVKRDRLDVIIGSRLRGPENRALGWIDFGGQRAQDTTRRDGSKTIVGTLDVKRPAIVDATEDALLAEFRKAGFEIG